MLAELETHLGEPDAAALCADLLGGADPLGHPHACAYLGGRPAAGALEGRTNWPEYWTRVWAARGLLYVWSDSVGYVVLGALRDEHWRVAEMCLKVAARRELPGADDAVRLASHDRTRVRVAAQRLLGVAGENEHVAVVTEGLDDEEVAVRRAAARALDLLGTRLDLPPSR